MWTECAERRPRQEDAGACRNLRAPENSCRHRRRQRDAEKTGRYEWIAVKNLFNGIRAWYREERRDRGNLIVVCWNLCQLLCVDENEIILEHPFLLLSSTCLSQKHMKVSLCIRFSATFKANCHFSITFYCLSLSTTIWSYQGAYLSFSGVSRALYLFDLQFGKLTVKHSTFPAAKLLL